MAACRLSGNVYPAGGRLPSSMIVNWRVETRADSPVSRGEMIEWVWFKTRRTPKMVVSGERLENLMLIDNNAPIDH